MSSVNSVIRNAPFSFKRKLLIEFDNNLHEINYSYLYVVLRRIPFEGAEEIKLLSNNICRWRIYDNFTEQSFLYAKP